MIGKFYLWPFGREQCGGHFRGGVLLAAQDGLDGFDELRTFGLLGNISLHTHGECGSDRCGIAKCTHDEHGGGVLDQRQDVIQGRIVVIQVKIKDDAINGRLFKVIERSLK